MSQKTHSNGRGVYECTATVAPGATETIYLPCTGPAAFAVHAQGSSAEASFSLSPVASIRADLGRYVPAAMGTNGTVTDASAATEITVPINAVRVKNTGTAPVYVEVLQ